jgi:hypothetical protein
MGFFSDLFGGKARRLERERLEREEQERARFAQEEADRAARKKQNDLRGQELADRFERQANASPRMSGFASPKRPPTQQVHQSTFKIDPRQPARRVEDDNAYVTQQLLHTYSPAIDNSPSRAYDTGSHHRTEDTHRHCAPADHGSVSHHNHSHSSHDNGCSVPDSPPDLG